MQIGCSRVDVELQFRSFQIVLTVIDCELDLVVQGIPREGNRNAVDRNRADCSSLLVDDFERAEQAGDGFRGPLTECGWLQVQEELNCVGRDFFLQTVESH